MRLSRVTCRAVRTVRLSIGCLTCNGGRWIWLPRRSRWCLIKIFFRALRARIARGPELSPPRAEESWAAALLLTARQLVPVMAVLLLVILGATLLWNQQPPGASQAAIRPRERVMFSDMYDYPAPTRDDVLETLVAIEERQNGK